MNAVSFDTLAIARKLKTAGFSEDQAEAATGVLREARRAGFTNLATKTERAGETYDILKWMVLSVIGSETIVIVGRLVSLSKGVR